MPTHEETHTETTPMLSRKSLELLKVLFGEQSNLQVPVAMAEQVLEIRHWAQVHAATTAISEPVAEP